MEGGLDLLPGRLRRLMSDKYLSTGRSKAFNWLIVYFVFLDDLTIIKGKMKIFL